MARSSPLLVAVVLGLALAGTGTFAPTMAEEELPDERDILSLIGPRAGEQIADLGCGQGRWTFALARSVGPTGKVFAVDIDAAVLEEVKARQVREGIDNVQVVQSKADDPSLPKAQLDAVFLNDVIDYVTRPALVGFLSGIRASLKEDGRLIIRDPNGGPDRIIAECYRAGFTLIEAKIPLPNAPARSFANDWYALKLRRSDSQHSVLPRLGVPARHRTRLLITEELFRAGVIPRDELRRIWEDARTDSGPYDPDIDERRALIAAAVATGAFSEERAAALLDAPK